MISCNEKALDRVAQEIRYTFFLILINKSFNIDIYRACLMQLLLLLNVIAFAIS